MRQVRPVRPVRPRDHADPGARLGLGTGEHTGPPPSGVGSEAPSPHTDARQVSGTWYPRPPTDPTATGSRAHRGRLSTELDPTPTPTTPHSLAPAATHRPRCSAPPHGQGTPAYTNPLPRTWDLAGTGTLRAHQAPHMPMGQAPPKVHTHTGDPHSMTSAWHPPHRILHTEDPTATLRVPPTPGPCKY